MTEASRNKLLKLAYPWIARATRCAPLSTYPALYFPYARVFRRPSPVPFTPWSLPDGTTNLVIEEPGSCGNHSMAAYFRKHNPEMKLATLTHCAASVRYAVAHDIPCIVLTRDILGYIHSSVSRFPHLYTPRVAVMCYASFYKSILNVMDRVVVARLHDITKDPRPTLQAVNDKFGTTFNIGDGVLPKIRATAEAAGVEAGNPVGNSE